MDCTAEDAASVENAGMRSGRLESRIQPRTGGHRFDDPGWPRRLTGLEPDRAVAGPDAQRLATSPEPALQGPALLVPIAVRRQIQVASDRSVARMRVELGAETGRQVDRDPAVAGRHRPVVLHRAPRSRTERNRAVAGMQLHAREIAGHAHTAVAGLHVRITGHVLERHLYVPRPKRQLPPHLRRPAPARP